MAIRPEQADLKQDGETSTLHYLMSEGLLELSKGSGKGPLLLLKPSGTILLSCVDLGRAIGFHQNPPFIRTDACVQPLKVDEQRYLSGHPCAPGADEGRQNR